MYIAYLDDSGSTGENLCDPQSPFQVVTSVIIRDRYFDQLEMSIAETIDEIVPEERRESFEFHANDLFRARGIFNSIGQEKCTQLLIELLTGVGKMKLPIVYGAVDKQQLLESEFASSYPLAAAFRAWAPGTQKWFWENAREDIGLIIADDTKNQHAKEKLREAFRECRKRLRVGPTLEVDRGLLLNFMDDMYFGDSAYSIGLQIADVCGFFICRHLCQRQDSEHLYKMIENNIYYEKIIPERPTYRKPGSLYTED